MNNKFIQAFNEVSSQVNEIKKANRNEFYYLLDNAIKFWCQQLNFSQYDYIHKGLKIYRIENLIDYLWEEWKPKPINRMNPLNVLRMPEDLECSELFNVTKPIFDKINIQFGKINIQSDKKINFSDKKINFIVILGFVITAVGYCIYLLNQPEQQEQIINPIIDDKPSKPSNEILPNILPPVVQPIVKKSLILVVSAKQKSIVDSIKAKGRIDYDDCEKLYEATQYLCQDTEPNLSPKLAKANQFQAIEKSEYDIYLITVKLNQADEGFNKNVNQLDRYDAFLNLAELAVKVSPRLQMEAYGIFDVYNR